MKIERRTLLKATAGLSLGGGALALGWVRWPRLPLSLMVQPASPFSVAEKEALEAVVEHLLPGAAAAGVPAFIDYWMVRAPFHEVLLPGFRLGLGYLDREAEQLGAEAFVTLEESKRDQVLQRFQQGALKYKRFTGRAFFEHLMRFTLEGYFSDPKYGGNRDGMGWELAGRQHDCWWVAHDHRDIES